MYYNINKRDKHHEREVRGIKFYGLKDWILKKNLTNEQRYACSVGDGFYISRETEKAVLIKNNTDFGTVSFWCPKSCLKTEEDIKKEIEAEQRWENAMESGLEYNKTLVEYAKANGVKGVRTGLRTKTLIEKIQKAGLEVPARA